MNGKDRGKNYAEHGRANIFDQTKENGILQTSIFKYILDLDTYELTAVDEYLSYDDSILDIKEKNQGIL